MIRYPLLLMCVAAWQLAAANPPETPAFSPFMSHSTATPTSPDRLRMIEQARRSARATDRSQSTVETDDEHFVFFLSQLRAFIEQGIEPFEHLTLSSQEAEALLAISALTARLRVEHEGLRSQQMCERLEADLGRGADQTLALNAAIDYFESRDTRAVELAEIVTSIQLEISGRLGDDMLDTIHETVAQRAEWGSAGRMLTSRGFYGHDDAAFIASRCGDILNRH